MAMNPSVLQAALTPAIKANIDSAFPIPSGVPTAQQTTLDNERQLLADAIAQAVAEKVVQHIQSFAVVTSTVTVISVAGVTTGAGISGPGTGTATGTVS